MTTKPVVDCTVSPSTVLPQSPTSAASCAVSAPWTVELLMNTFAPGPATTPPPTVIPMMQVEPVEPTWSDPLVLTALLVQVTFWPYTGDVLARKFPSPL